MHFNVTMLRFYGHVRNKEGVHDQLYTTQFYETCVTHAISNWDAIFSSAGRIYTVGLSLQARDYSVPTISTTGHVTIDGLGQP